MQPEVTSKSSDRPAYVLVVPWDVSLAGGVNQVVVNLHREMQTAGEYKPVIMVEKWSAVLPQETDVEGRFTVYLRLWPPLLDHKSILWLVKWILGTMFFIPSLLKFCHRHRVTVFNIHYPSLSCFPIALLRFLRLFRGSFILSFHGSDLYDAEKTDRSKRALWRFILSQATAIVACSEAFASDVRKFAGNRADRVHVVYNGLDVDFFIKKPEVTNELPAVLLNRRFILSVAAYARRKGLDVLLHSFDEIRHKHPDIALVLVGWGPAESDLRALTNKLGLSDDVFFFQSVPHQQIGLYLARAAVFCLPSRSEPFGIVILEAGAFHLPVVATCIGGIPEIVTDGETGLLVEADNVKALSSALEHVLTTTDFANSLGDRLYQHVVSNFSWQQAYKKYRSLLAY